MNWVEIEFKDKTYRIPAEKKAGQLWFHWQGESYCYEPPRKSKGKQSASTAEPGKILAPMPGKIIKVLAEKDQVVVQGQPLVVMEAMKMEYTLSADIDGKVAELKCKESDQVSLGQVLVQIKES